jgi:hypothetical protein
MNEVGAVLVSGLVGALVAIWAILSQRQISRRQVTLEHITRLETDKDFNEAVQRFIAIAHANGGILPYAEEDKEKDPDTQKVKLVLNTFELIAIAIHKRIIDAEMYSRWFRSGTIRYWNHAHLFVDRLRDRLNNPKIYHELEQMVDWLGNAPPKRRWWPRIFK